MTGRTPIRDLNQRAPEQGRIRTGKKSEKGYPQKLDAFRFTSADEEAIRAIAEKYDSEAYEWKNAPGGKRQWEVLTATSRIPVSLPHDCLGDGVIYEWWQGGYCARRCDGENCQVPQDGPDGPELATVDCLCAHEKGPPKCKSKLRLNVVLTDIKPFGGTWRLETSSEHAVRELPGMVDMILSMQDRTPLTGAVLILDQRTKTKIVKGKPQTQHFGVPMLAVPHTLDAMIGGAAAIGTYGRSPAAIGSGPEPALGSDARDGVSGSDSYPAQGSGPDGSDDDVAEAEIVDAVTDEQIEALRLVADQIVTGWNTENPESEITTEAFLQSAAAMLSGRSDQRLADLDEGHARKLGEWMEKVLAGEIAFDGIRGGRIKQRRAT